MYPVKRLERTGTMSTKLFSTEEIVSLRSSPYIRSVSDKFVSFTTKFKELAYRELMSGKSMRTVFRDNGIDPDILGATRVDGFRFTLMKNAERIEGFANLNERNHRRPAESREATLEGRVKQLEHELAYTRQEVEFLKKIQRADLEARKSWESGHRRK
jgi:hypothetical protein